MKYDFEAMAVDVEQLIKAANGDYNAVGFAFWWGETPQGHDYWNSQYTGEKELQVEVLKDMLEQYNEWIKGYSYD